MTIRRAAASLPFLAVLLLIPAAAAFAQDAFRLALNPNGAAGKLGWYQAQKIELGSTRPATLIRIPGNLKSPLYGILPIGDDTPAGAAPGAAPGGRRYHVALDEPFGGRAVLYVDADGNGDLTNDPPVEWRSDAASGAPADAAFGGGATIRLGASGAVADTSPGAVIEVRIGMYRYDRNDPKRQADRNSLFYYRDYAYLGEVDLGGTSYQAALSDEAVGGDFRGRASGGSSGVALLLDLNRDGTFQNPREALDVRRPFNIGGVAYEIADMAPLGDRFRIVKSTAKVAETRPLPNHAVGRKITAFEARTMDGAPVRFPSDYKNKVVLLDLWATWCGPCMEEIPGLAAVRSELAPLGFEVLGVSLDDAGQADRIRSVLKAKGMVWPQIYDGGGWQTGIAALYAIDSIPAAFLVDGDTGEILAAGNALRGRSLASTVEKALRKKGK